MPKTFARLLPAAACLLPNLLFAAAQPTPPTTATNGQDSDCYTVQSGDTLVGIARRLGLTPQALAKANALDRPDKIAVGNVLRLPVTPPETHQPATAPTPAQSPAVRPVPAATPPETAQPAAPPQAPTPSARPPAKADEATGDAARLAVGAYANPTLGSLRVTQTAAGIAVSRDNRTISMRHLLYGVFDGSDASGDIQSLRLQYDDAGQVRALLYSSASGKDIPFARVKK